VECCGQLCPAGDTCTNRCFQNASEELLELFWTHSKGWGARATRPLTKGQFVIEYVGEIIDLKTCAERIQEVRAKDKEVPFPFLFSSLSSFLSCFSFSGKRKPSTTFSAWIRSA